MFHDQTRQTSHHRFVVLDDYGLCAHKACWFLARLKSEGAEKIKELAISLLELLQDASREKLSLR